MTSRELLRRLAALALVPAAGCGGNPDPSLGALPSDPCAGAWVRLYDDASFGARRLTIEYPNELASLRAVGTDSGSGDLNDRASSAQWSIPVGCAFVLYEDENFRGSRFQLLGTGRAEQNANLGPFNDRASAGRWDRS